MPTRSRNARTKARQKRTNSLLRRGFKEAAFHANRNLGIILMLLSQHGGEITVAGDTVAKVAANLASMAYVINPNPDDVGGITVSVQTQVAAASLPTESLEEMKARMQAAHNGDLPAYEPPAGSVTASLADAAGILTPEQQAKLNAELDAMTPIDPTDAAGDPA